MRAGDYLLPPQNFLGLTSGDAHPASAGVVVLPVPFERTSTFGRGSCAGPAAILAASQQVELFDVTLGYEPYRAAGGIATLPPWQTEVSDSAVLADNLCQEVKSWLSRGKFLITLGGEHTSIVGAIWAHCEIHPDLTVLQLDAHSDLRAEYLGSAWNHACAMARVRDRHESLVQVGVRSQDRSEWELVQKQQIPVFYAHRIHQDREGAKDWIAAVIAATRSRVYISLDCDVLDPAIIPATGTPEPGGLTWAHVDALLARLCREREVLGLDVSELAPVTGLTHPQFTVAKLIYRFLGHRYSIKGRSDRIGHDKNPDGH